MSYEIIPNIIFIVSVFGILLMVLRHLPEAGRGQQTQPPQPGAEEALLEKGLPAQAISKVRVALKSTTKKVWNFILEAKDLNPQSATGYKIKKIFGGKLPGFKKPEPVLQTFHEVKNEKYYLDMIKHEPKNLARYDALGRFYLDQENIGDAQDIYLYAVNHEPSNPDYQARLAYCYYQSKNFTKAAEHYQKSTALDSTQPNRYYNLSLALKAAGQGMEAKAAVLNALELEPSNPKYAQALRQIEKA